MKLKTLKIILISRKIWVVEKFCIFPHSDFCSYQSLPPFKTACLITSRVVAFSGTFKMAYGLLSLISWTTKNDIRFLPNFSEEGALESSEMMSSSSLNWLQRKSCDKGKGWSVSLWSLRCRYPGLQKKKKSICIESQS